MPIPAVSKFELKNDAVIVCDIHAIYTDENGAQHEVGNHHNLKEFQTATMDLKEKCPDIYTGAQVTFKVWVSLGTDNTYTAQVFSYDPNGPTRKFKISGTTVQNSVQYLG